MKIILVRVSFVLLLFEQYGCVFGFTIPKIQQQDSFLDDIDTEASSQTEIFKVKEGDRETVKLIYPKPEKPTLREIIYYHLIETPYENSQKIEERLEGPDFDDTRRPFTNSHGLPFVSDQSNGQDLNEAHARLDADVTDEEANTDDEENNDDMNPEPDLDERDNFSTKTMSDEEIVDDEDKLESDQDETGDVGEYTDDKMEELLTASNVAADDEDSDTEISTKRVDTVIEEKKIARKNLFSEARNKYQNARRLEKPSRRRKRELDIKDIPEAPRLGPMNLSAFPEHIQKLISLSEIEMKKPSKLHDETTQYNENDFKEELKDKIQQMLTNVKPGDDKDTQNDQQTEDGKGKREVRTYGMNLTKTKGRIWNNLWTDPGISFDVGSLESVENIKNNKEEVTIKNPEFPEDVKFKPVAHPTESKPIVNQDKDHNSQGFLIHVIGNNNSDEEKNTASEDISINIAESNKSNEDANDDSKEFIIHVPENNQSNEVVQDLDDIFIETLNKAKALKNNLAEEGSDSKKLSEEKDNEKTNRGIDNQKITKHETEEGNSDEKQTTNDGIKSVDKDGNSDVTEAKKGDIEQADFFKELMKNEEFWKWLGDWTATYMELLMKHIKRFVHDEVKRQMKAFAANIKNQKDGDSKGDYDTIKDMHTDQIEEKIVVDGKEIALTHKTNFNKEEKESILMKHRKDKDNDKESIANSNKDNPISIRAKNIFGNTVGTDKVTNIFIFYPTEDLKPDSDSSNNTFVFEPNASEEIEIDKRIKPNKESEGNNKTGSKPDDSDDVNINKQRDTDDKDSNIIDTNKETDEGIDKQNNKDDLKNQNNNNGIENKASEGKTEKSEDVNTNSNKEGSKPDEPTIEGNDKNDLEPNSSKIVTEKVPEIIEKETKPTTSKIREEVNTEDNISELEEKEIVKESKEELKEVENETEK